MFIVSPLPGSTLYDDCLKKGYIKGGFEALDFKFATISIPNNSKEDVISQEDLENLVGEKT
jgi:hypothetical protein